MNKLPTEPPAAGVRIDPALLETAKRRAARLRAQAIGDAIEHAAGLPQALLRSLLARLQRTSAAARRSAATEAAPCRS